jgi:hypothetical protein
MISFGAALTIVASVRCRGELTAGGCKLAVEMQSAGGAVCPQVAAMKALRANVDGVAGCDGAAATRLGCDYTARYV